MLTLEPGIVLDFSQVVATAAGNPQNASDTDDGSAESAARKARLSTCNLRLSFGDSVFTASRHIQEDPERRSVDTSQNTFDKFDRLFLNTLFCLPQLKNDRRGLNLDLTEENLISRKPVGKTRYFVRTSVGPKSVQDEFLVISKNVAVHGYGLDSKFRKIVQNHSGTESIVDATWCTFRHHSRQVRPEHATITPVLEYFPPLDTVCIVEPKKIHVLSESGENYAQASSFPIRKIWSYPLGLLLERDCQAASNLFNVDGYPNMFSMSTHLDEPSPILFLGDERGKPTEYLSQLLRPDCVVVGVGDELPLVLIFDHARNVHSLWLGRFSTAEEMDQATDVLKNRNDHGERLHFHGIGDSPLQKSRSKSQTRRSLNNLDSFKLPIPPSSSIKSPLSGIPPRKKSLHRDVLLSATGRFNQSDTSSVRTPLLNDPRRINLSESSQSELGEPSHRTPESMDISVMIPSDLSVSSLSSSRLQSFAMNSSGSQIPVAKRLCNSSPNISAHALKNLRSASSSFAPSRAHSLASFMESGTSGRRGSRSASTLNSKRTIRTHPSQTAPLSADELAYPKIALVHVWNDSLKVSHSGEGAFLLKDFMKQTYFCYVLPAEKVLRCVQLNIVSASGGDYLNVSASGSSSIPALSAVKISSQNLIVVLDPKNRLKLYSSPDCLLIEIKYPSTLPDNLNFILPSFLNTNLPSTSSLATSSPHVQLPSKQVHSPNFSPVPNSTPLGTDVKDPVRSKNLLACAGNQFILEESGGVQLFCIPERPSSDLIDKCLICLRDCLEADLFKTIYRMMWENSFSEAGSSISLEKRWRTFFEAVFSVLGFKVTSAPPSNETVTPYDLYRTKAASLGLTNLPSFGANGIDDDHSKSTEITLEFPKPSPGSRYSSVILLMLHLIFEESQLAKMWSVDRKFMLPWMVALGTVFQDSQWTSYYELKFSEYPVEKKVKITLQNPTGLKPNVKLPNVIPDIFHTLNELIYGRKCRYLIVNGVNPLSKKLILLASAFGSSEKVSRNTVILELLRKLDIKSDDLEYLPPTLKVAFQSAFRSISESAPFSQLPKIVFEVSKRSDAEMCKNVVEGRQIRDFKSLKRTSELDAPKKKSRFYLSHEMVTKRFSSDARIREAERLLNSWETVVIPLSMTSDNEVLFLKSQEAWLKSVAPRTMSLPVGRGMLGLRSEFAYATEKLSAPPMVYDGVERSSVRALRKVVSLKTEDHPNGHDFWPRFHNGVATGLRLRHFDHDKIKFDHHWLAFNAGQLTKRESVDYAGIFLGMALNGLIDSNTDPMELHNLLVRLEDCVSIAVLIGMACVKRGTQDKRYYRMIGLHILSFMPDSGVELIIPQNIHVASLLSLGLLYRSSGNRFVSERLLNEISAVSLTDGENTQTGVPEREAASLSAAFGLGFVLLGLGNESFLGLADLEIPERLRTLMVGGYLSRCKIRKSKEDDSLINTHVTSPGATLALAMIFMKTERHDVAEWMSVPQTLEELDQIRPDFLILRVVAKSLILWNSVEATEKWVNSNFPKWILKNVFIHSRDLEKDGLDVVSLTQAYFFILAGSAMSLGLKFAGTATPAAQNILMTMSLMMVKWSEDSSLTERCSQSLMQMCLTTIMIALANVMAGTGDLGVFRLLRYMHGRTSAPRAFTTYGHQMGVHMAIGLLFLGCGMYTVGTSNEALAAMLVAYFPIWPKNASDNRYHLQAFRHLYILAVENRLLLTKNHQDGLPVQTKIRVTGNDQSFMNLSTPCVLPELSRLEKIEIASGKFILTFTGEKNWEDLRKLLAAGGVYVFPPSSNSERGSALNRKSNSLLSHFERNLYWPSSNEEDLLKSMKNFQKNCWMHCWDHNYASLFERACKDWLEKPVKNHWIPWVIFECSFYGDLDAFERIMALSKETDERLKNIAHGFFKMTDPMEKRNKWKNWLEKSEFMKRFAAGFSGIKTPASSSDESMDVIEIPANSTSDDSVETIIVDLKS